MKKKKKNKAGWIVVVIALLGISGAVFMFFLMDKVVRTVVLEAGTVLPAQQLLKTAVDEPVCFEDNSTEFVSSVPGIYHLKLKVGSFVHTVKVMVQDTVAPTAQVQEKIVPYGETCTAEEMVTGIVDATKVTVAFVAEPNWNLWGSQDVQLSLTDAAGNAVHMTSKLIIPTVDVMQPYVLEAGEKLPNPSVYLLTEGEISYGANVDQIDIHTPGIYPCTVRVDDEEYQMQVEIKDTIAPVMELAPVNGYLQSMPLAEAFVTSATDETTIVYSYVNTPDMEKEGEQTVEIMATDAGGNQTTGQTILTLGPDTEAPIIYGIGNLSVCLGENVSYKKGVSVVDNCDSDIALEIDNSAVDMNTIGIYPVTYSATDRAGNKVVQTVELSVLPERELTVSQEDMYALADEVLAKIIKDNMSDYDKAQAIFTWTKGNIGWVDSSGKEDWVETAYKGFTYHNGDCYTYACVSKALLTRAGIPNIDIMRKSERSHHYWNLVDCGNGWYHFDATPRTDKTIIFMWSENQILADPAVARTHVYDHSLYPAVNAD